MNRWVRLAMLASVAAASLSAACASRPPLADAAPPADVIETFLAGASLDAARSLAMGVARTKGWTVSASGPSEFTLDRELSRSAPQAQALSVRPDAPAPRIQVVTRLAEQGGGVRLGLTALVIANPGTPDEQRIDYTRDYQDALVQSLDSLQRAWREKGDQVAAKTAAPRPAATPAVGSADGPVAPAAAPADPGAVAALPEPESADNSPWEREPPRLNPPPADSDGVARSLAPPPDAGAAAARLAGDAAAPAAVAGGAGLDDPAPARPSLEAEWLPAPDDVTLARPELEISARPNEMLVLDSGARKGLWAYYAEQAAQGRGCALTDLGAVLLQKTAAFELHEVHCDNGPNVLLKCQGGICEDMR